MSKERNSIRLSEFAEFLNNDDDSDGHRLAQFLQRKRGKVFPKRVFDEQEEERFDLSVNVERLKTPAAVGAVASAAAPPEDQPQQDQPQQDQQQQDQQQQDQQQKGQPQQEQPQQIEVLEHEADPENVESPPRRSAPPVVISPVEAAANSPRVRLSTLRKSGGIISSADRLRRYSLKRSLALNSGRRMLLKEFENTIDSVNFAPPVCSTPMTTPTSSDAVAQDKTLVPMVVLASPLPNNSCAALITSEPQSNVDPPSSPQSNYSNSSQLMAELQRKDEDLRAMLESVVETTLKKVNEEKEKSRREAAATSSPPSKPTRNSSVAATNNRSYIVEKGPAPGQVLLTPTRPSSALQAAAASGACPMSPLRCQQSPSGGIKVRNPEELLADPKSASRFKSAYELSPSKLTVKRKKPSQIPRRQNVVGSALKNAAAATLKQQTEAVLAATPERQNYLEISEDDDDIPETQEQLIPVETQRLVQAVVQQRRESQQQQQQQSPIIVMPLTQTFNGTQPPELQTMTFVAAPNNTYTITQQQQQKQQKQQNETKRGSMQSGEEKFVARVPRPVTPNITLKQTKENKEKTLQSEPLVVSEDELRLNDIITDDDDEEVAQVKLQQKQQKKLSAPSLSNTPVAESNSIALNLASSGTSSGRARRLRKRSTQRRRLPLDGNITLQSTETETEVGPPRAHPLNLRRYKRESNVHALRRHLVPLNKAPSSPINGEKFACELKTQLARLSNYEILDLRKRNSLGKVNPALPLKKSAACTRNQSQRKILEQRLQLEEKIQEEILKRQLEGNNEGLESDDERQQEVFSECVDEDIYVELTTKPPSPPQTFKDSAQTRDTLSPPLRLSPVETALQQVLSGAGNQSLLEGGSSDCISFMPPPPSSRRKSKTRNKTQLTEVVQNYLDVTKKISKRKQKSTGVTKRSLYTKGLSDSEETANSSFEKDNRTQRNTIGEKGKSPLLPLSVVPPPPPFSTQSEDELLELRVVSPPPPLLDVPREQATSVSPSLVDPPMKQATPPSSQQKRRSKKRAAQVSPLPLPPPALFSDQDTIIAETTANADAVFKKPMQPAPKARSQARKRKNPPECISDTTSELNTSILRRSKRGHVPLKNTWSFSTNSDSTTPLFTIMFTESLRLTEERRQKRLEKIKQVQKEAAAETRKNSAEKQQRGETLPIASSTANSYSAVATEPPATKKRGRPRIAKAVPPLLPQHSYLGDTNTSRSTSVATSVRSLSPIFETQQPETIFEDEAEQEQETPKTTAPKKKQQQQIEVITKKQRTKKTLKGILEHSRIELSQPPVEQLNDMFDQLKRGANILSMPESQSATLPAPPPHQQSSSDDSTKSVKKVRVRLQRLRLSNADASTDVAAKSKAASTEASTSSGVKAINAQQKAASNCSKQPAQGGTELLSWLRGMSDVQTSNENNQIFQTMHCSAAGNLIFTDLEGIDYAFYDTEEKTSLGYLRFKPLQCKASKRAKKYHLHFVVLSGEFKISTNREVGSFSTGDMVAINKGSRYTIENTSNDISLIMVIKK